jgi:hypothetical protein
MRIRRVELFCTQISVPRNEALRLVEVGEAGADSPAPDAQPANTRLASATAITALLVLVLTMLL